jgi:hypothetical protein
MKIIEVEPIRTRRSTTLVDNEPCTDAAKDMAGLAWIMKLVEASMINSGYILRTSTL